MGNAWFRMYAEFLHDPKVQMLSEADQRRYIMLLCVRCGNDDVTLQDEEVTFLLRVTDDEWKATKSALLAKNLIDENNQPTAWDKRQCRSDSSAERVARHREKQKQGGNVTVTPQNKNKNIRESNDSLVARELAPCPHREILSLFADLLPTLSQPKTWEGSRATNLAARWKSVLATLKAKGKPHDHDAGIDYFRRMFGYIAKSDFLMGRAGKWQASLGWIVKAENFAKIIDGDYENREAA